jgi:hypothetical protein
MQKIYLTMKILLETVASHVVPERIIFTFNRHACYAITLFLRISHFYLYAKVEIFLSNITK